MNACAYVVAPAKGPGTLLEAAHALDFELVLPFRGTPAAERQTARTPLVFFLFETAADPRTHAPVVASIRASAKADISFAPLIFFARNPSRETIRTCINMGFDDIVTLPFARPQLRQRLDRQMDGTCVYFQTDSYFGPDRRNRLQDFSDHSGRGSGGQFRRFEILRSPHGGVRVLSDEQQVVVV